ncbi:hypothetical protein H257_08561 [Aphanomyces astaci]|uniref:WRKY19-like zinc finger domain-containing protein n=1 Tax=Aphanomyces astaci TaxID=112090 RepID=W4GEH7_APHAT|nr:hypothetical protein H257_08561 [Aphanomyces astaci]ETV77671.1 hypothetical protein H257_08561 [Aphanomyces astaci]|eukprot:XP_009832781.1 hypothetical protein H257_08561 [Aphanomyces astaci]
MHHGHDNAQPPMYIDHPQEGYRDDAADVAIRSMQYHHPQPDMYMHQPAQHHGGFDFSQWPSLTQHHPHYQMQQHVSSTLNLPTSSNPTTHQTTSSTYHYNFQNYPRADDEAGQQYPIPTTSLPSPMSSYTVTLPSPYTHDNLGRSQHPPPTLVDYNANNNYAAHQVAPELYEVPNQCLDRQCTAALRYRGYCKLHGGARKCSVAYCTKGIQGRNRCIAHGGGKRCQHSNCVRAAQSHGLCKSHGGGTRCKFHGCVKTSQGGGYCRTHGGGRECKWPGCSNSAQRRELCAKHGQKRICNVAGCGRTDRGGGFCMSHRKDKICRVEGCTRLIATTVFAGVATMCAQHVSEQHGAFAYCN